MLVNTLVKKKAKIMWNMAADTQPALPIPGETDDDGEHDERRKGEGANQELPHL